MDTSKQTSMGSPEGREGGGAATLDRTRWIHEALASHEGALIAYARRLLVGDLERARDVVQETFLRLCRTSPHQLCDAEDTQAAGLDGSPGAKSDGAVPPVRVTEWLFTVCRNLALDVLRKESRMATWNEEGASARASEAPPPGEAIEREDEVQHAIGLIRTLPDKQQEALLLKFQHGHSYKAISRITGQSVGNVGWLIHMGMKTLRAQWTARGAEGARG